jgi:CHAT domain-containing protein
LLIRRLGGKGAPVIYSNVAWDDPQLVYIDGRSSSGHVIDKAATVKDIYNRLGREIERFMGEKKTDIIFTVGQKTRRDYYSIEFEKIINFYRHLASKKYVTAEEKDALRFIGRALYDLLLGRVAGKMDEKSELLIQPDGVLSTLPFETLVMPDGRYLVEKFGVSYVHSHRVCAAAARRVLAQNRAALFLMGGAAAPDKPEPQSLESVRHFDLVKRGAVEAIVRGGSMRGMYGFFGVEGFGEVGEGNGELEALGEAWSGAGRLVGNDLTETGLSASSRTGVLARYRIIHIASRALVVLEVPILSAIAVAPKGTGIEDGLVNFREIASLKTGADLVMLANTFITPARFSRGEGVWSLCGAFIDSGTRNVAVSIWPVEEPVKSAFLKQVYRHVIDGGIPLGEAFTRTKREFITNRIDAGRNETPGMYASPHFWGSFMVYGY